MQLIIDRFEGEYAVCETVGKVEMFNIPTKILPNGVKEGTVLDMAEGQYTINDAETADRANRIQNLLNSLWE